MTDPITTPPDCPAARATSRSDGGGRRPRAAAGAFDDLVARGAAPPDTRAPDRAPEPETTAVATSRTAALPAVMAVAERGAPVLQPGAAVPDPPAPPEGEAATAGLGVNARAPRGSTPGRAADGRGGHHAGRARGLAAPLDATVTPAADLLQEAPAPDGPPRHAADPCRAEQSAPPKDAGGPPPVTVPIAALPLPAPPAMAARGQGPRPAPDASAFSERVGNQAGLPGRPAAPMSPGGPEISADPAAAQADTSPRGPAEARQTAAAAAPRHAAGTEPPLPVSAVPVSPPSGAETADGGAPARAAAVEAIRLAAGARALEPVEPPVTRAAAVEAVRLAAGGRALEPVEPAVTRAAAVEAVRLAAGGRALEPVEPAVTRARLDNAIASAGSASALLPAPDAPRGAAAPAPGTPSTPGAPAEPATPAPVHEQIVRAMALTWRNGIGEARVSLDPSTLGGLSVALRIERGVVTATMTTDVAAVRDVIQAHARELRDGLAGRGLELGRLVVTADPDRGHREPGGDRRQVPRRWLPRPSSRPFELDA